MLKAKKYIKVLHKIKVANVLRKVFSLLHDTGSKIRSRSKKKFKRNAHSLVKKLKTVAVFLDHLFIIITFEKFCKRIISDGRHFSDFF